MSKKITDAGVARLGVHEGRAELLEEIMATNPLETVEPSTARDPRRPSPVRRWLPAVGAAAAVAAVAAGAVWLGELDATAPEPGTDAPLAAAPGSGDLAVLEIDGWELDHAYVDARHGGELGYVPEGHADDPPVTTKCTATPPGSASSEPSCTVSGEQAPSLDITWSAADSHADYVRDREHITRPPSEGEAVEVLGVPGLLWAYSPDDHTVIRDVVGDYYLEIRGSMMSKAEFLDLLGQLTAVEPAALDAHLPAEFVTDGERADVIAGMLADVPVPDGFDRAIESDEVDRYHLGADVTGAVTCAWIELFANGDAATRQEARDALATSRDWAVLDEMDAEGDWSEVVWEYADSVAAGDVPEGYQHGIGCQD